MGNASLELPSLELGLQGDVLDPAIKSQPSNWKLIHPSLQIGFGGKTWCGSLRTARVEWVVGMGLERYSGIGEWDWWYFWWWKRVAGGGVEVRLYPGDKERVGEERVIGLTCLTVFWINTGLFILGMGWWLIGPREDLVGLWGFSINKDLGLLV